MTISINIPTYKRAGKVDTLALLPSATLWVHSVEVDAYAAAHPKANLEVLPDATKGNLARVRNHILDARKDAAVTVLIDDDVKAIARWQRNKRFKYRDADEVGGMIERYSQLAEDWGAMLWGIQLNSDKQSYREYGPFSTVGYISASFSCFLKGNALRYDERLPLKEDYDMLLQQTNRYRVNLRVNNHYLLKEAVSNVGGCADIRTQGKEREQLAILQKKWGSAIVDINGDRHQQNHKTTKRRAFDLNPVVRVPIRGV